jgi:3'(2'), 5'-bisphosphate nucleotidase
MKPELQSARELALRAGEILLKHYAQEPTVQWKGQNDPVTIADLEASRFLVGELRKRFPNDAILCEEEQDDFERLGNARVWLVDPMDGTKEFIARRGEFAAMIGLAVDGNALLGVVYQPTERKLYYGDADEGAYLEIGSSVRRLHVSGETALSNATMAMSRSHPSRITEAIRTQLGIQRTIRTGSLGIKVGLLCEGLAHVYVQGRGTSLWDTCGPEAILHAAGGKMTDRLGNPLRYDVSEVRNLAGVIATNGVLHDQVVQTARAVMQQGDVR